MWFAAQSANVVVQQADVMPRWPNIGLSDNASGGNTQHANHCTLDSFHGTSCADCVQNGCSYCAGPDVQTCFDQEKYPNWCNTLGSAIFHQRIAPGDSESKCPKPLIANYSHGCPTVENEICTLLKCTALSESESRNAHLPHCCCRLPLIPWLEAQKKNPPTFSWETFPRFDVLMKAQVALSWLSGDQEASTRWDAIYEEYISHRIGGLWSSNLVSERQKNMSIRLEMFRGLFNSVRRNGFNWKDMPIVVDNNLVLKDGSHRVAIALALGETHVTVARECGRIHAKHAQTLDYFHHALKHTPDASKAAELIVANTPNWKLDWSRRRQERLHVFIWGCAKALWTPILNDIRDRVLVVSARKLRLNNPAEFVRAVYAVDDVTKAKIEFKAKQLARCRASDEVLSVTIQTADPRYRAKGNKAATLISMTMEALKSKIRSSYRHRVANYTHDIIIHGADNFAQHTRRMSTLAGIVETPNTTCSKGNAWACAAQEMKRRNVSINDWLVVGSSVLNGLLGRTSDDIDLVVRPSVRERIAKGVAGEVELGHGVHMTSRWLQPVGDDELLDLTRWHTWTYGALRVRHISLEVEVLHKRLRARAKDVANLNRLCSLPFAYKPGVLAYAARRMGSAVRIANTDSAKAMAGGLACWWYDPASPAAASSRRLPVPERAIQDFDMQYVY